ncbi:MAG: Hsp70 family protein [Planctomycetia bacterium]|nr:Hsp70 family protein [Planctomycetia bacterium]
MPAIGIDLGTSNSVVAVYRRGRPESLPVQGQSLMPSCVAVKPGGGLLIGIQAKTRSLVEPTQAVLAIKRHMGDREHRVELAGQSYSPVDISALILQKLAEAAQDQLGEPAGGAVISVPAYFTNNQKEDTRLAGEKAGLRVLGLVPEPTAAAIAYGLNQGKDQTILVFDLGGGTFDVSVLQVKGNNFEVKAIGGDHALGGEDFDRRLIDLLVRRLRNEGGLSSNAPEAEIRLLNAKLKEVAEAAKKELSVADAAEVTVPDTRGALRVMRITRAEYEGEIRDLVEKTIVATLETLKRARLSADDVDRVVLVGGSTRVPLIARTLAERVSEPYTADNVDEVVAHGAAIMAASLSAVAEELAPIEVTNITAHSLGIQADKDRFAVVIPRGTKLPAQAVKTFTTARDNADRTDVVIFQGEDEKCNNNRQIGGVGLTGIARAPAGLPKIDVTFSIDADDVLKVTAADRTSARTGEVVIERFTPKPYQPGPDRNLKDLQSLRFGVSGVGCDNAGMVLRGLGLSSRDIEDKDFRRAAVLANYDVVFINCMADSTQLYGLGDSINPELNAPALQEFVSRGGVLYVSDFAYGNISVPFPGKIKFGERFQGVAGTATATVADPDLRALVGPTCPIEFNLAYLPALSARSDCRVYLTRGKEPLLISFPHGNGHVVYTSFHNSQQQSEKAQQLLSYIILQTIALAANTPLVELVESNNLRDTNRPRRG